MPTNDDPAPAPPPRVPRRGLGRGPGTHQGSTPPPPGTATGGPAAPPEPVDPAGTPEPATPAEPAESPREAAPEPAGHTGATEPRAGADGAAQAPHGDAPPQPPGADAPPAAPGDEAVPPGDLPPDDVPPGAEPEAEAVKAADGGGEPPADDGRFTVRLANFEGPFDLLLQLISRRKMDVTEVALSQVTDEFMAHIRAMGPDWDLDQTTEFLVVAATLLDLKAARLLPSAEVEDEADLALLEARDLLFARLLQYRAYKRIADIFQERLDGEARRYPRTVGLEAHHAELLPEVVIRIGADGFAKLAVKAMQPKAKPQVYVDHIHAPLVSVREQAEVVIARLRQLGATDFQTLTADAPDTLTVVARFLALLELYRERVITLDQEEALGALRVRWTGAEGERPRVTDEFDQQPGEREPATPAPPAADPEPAPRTAGADPGGAADERVAGTSAAVPADPGAADQQPGGPGPGSEWEARR
ncbi:segregation and condensation protein A [Streptomyces buecherae]|uniref:segregation and condensation protein A n=2 Tax=Streptomyces buecherae TaxID=2763006 RepID=UPI001E412144|nr:ScpA family protein [Streptomyces buecherae]